jgi:hypothetical protein
MRRRSSALLALLALAGCAERAEQAVEAPAPQRHYTLPIHPLPHPAATDEAKDPRPPLTAEQTSMLVAAYRFELTLHASDADIEEFGGFFLDYPPPQEQAFLAEFARNAPPVRPRHWCRFTDGRAVIDLMTGKPGANFVGDIKDMDLTRGEGLVAMSWWSDPELAAGAIIALKKQDGNWEVTGYQLLWFR